MTPENAYVSSREAADMLGVSLRTAQLWVEAGVLIAWKTPGGHRRIMRSSVEQVLAERAKIHQTEISPAQLRVVIVEDDPDITELLSLTICQHAPSIEVLVAKDGFEGLVLIGKTRPHLVITDLNMPGMDGFMMIRAMEDAEFSPRKIVVVTALSPADIAERGGLPSRITVLEKPLAISAIEKLIQAEYGQHPSAEGSIGA